MNIIVVGVGDRPTYINNLLTYTRAEGFRVTYVSAGERADVRVNLWTGTDIEFLVRFTFLVLLNRIETDVDVIHTRRIVTFFPFVLKRTDAKLVATCPGHLTEELKMNHSQAFVWVYNIIESLAIEATDEVISVSNSCREYLLKKHPSYEDRIRTIPVGVDTDVFHPMNRKQLREEYGIGEEHILLYAGRFSPVKNLPLLINAFNILNETEDEWRLLLAGKGDCEEELREMVAEHNLSSVIEFVGYVDQEKLSKLMNIADCLALTSRSEGSPNVVREALACGLPVVTTDVGDMNVLIQNGENGFIVEETSPDQFARYVSITTNKPQFRSAAKSTKTGFENTFEQILKVYGYDREVDQSQGVKYEK